MTTSSEDVLLSVGHVRYKKGDGTLYVMNQRLAWMLENRDTVAVSHKYADIKTQKISPAGKPKVQLQVVLHDGTCSTFQFVNSGGPEAQAKDRDQVKMLLQNLLPKFKRQIDGELEMKSKLLSLHPTLKHLYEDLVISKVINSEEYWNTPTLKHYTESTSMKQEADDDAGEKEKDGTSIHRSMIKRFNQHSIMVLKASHQKATNSTNSSSNSNSKTSNNNNKVVENGVKETNGVEKRAAQEKDPSEPVDKKKRILEKLHYEDLDSVNIGEDAQELKLSKVERYLLGPSSQVSQACTSTNNPPPLSALASICQAWSSGQQCQRPFRVSASAAVGALGELSPGGALMRQHHASCMAQLIPTDVKNELHRIYLSGGELLRELWRCFPQPGAAAESEDTPARAEKFYEALLRFRNVKLRPFEDKMLRELTPLASSLTKHMNQMIDAACAKYAMWQQRQAKLR
ncbi:jg20513 [Pararge aegeria aegeria]|uniref:General transcription factor IIH subunit 1 n=1 Tax=Pararge aegeria aegeria TaxID=348720 RepID=A0A8S4S7R8_9NEOP|nr:jg20513 [Pararge aegeria aegeria]